MIACMCLVCHRAIQPAWDKSRTAPRALFCLDNDGKCRAAWYRTKPYYRNYGGNKRLSPRSYTQVVYAVRDAIAHQRRLEAVLAYVQRVTGLRVAA